MPSQYITIGGNIKIENGRVTIAEDDEEEYEYSCQQCGTGSNPDDHRKIAYNWCNECDDVTTHSKND